MSRDRARDSANRRWNQKTKVHREKDTRTDEQKAADRAALLAAIRAKHEKKRNPA
jgi:hypothetical protein